MCHVFFPWSEKKVFSLYFDWELAYQHKVLTANYSGYCVPITRAPGGRM